MIFLGFFAEKKNILLKWIVNFSEEKIYHCRKNKNPRGTKEYSIFGPYLNKVNFQM